MYSIKSKEAFKKHAGRCAFCEESDYAVLDVHRIIEGRIGGEYHSINSVVTCANCHRKIHDGQIIIVKKHISFGDNPYVLEYYLKDEISVRYLPMKY